MLRPHRRRTVLRLCCSGLVAGLAGCSDLDAGPADDSPTTRRPGTGHSPVTSGTETPVPSAPSVERCGDTWDPTVLWERNVGQPRSRLVVDGSNLYVDGDTALLAYDLDGTRRNRVETDGVASVEGGLALVPDDGTLRAVDLPGGTTAWTWPFADDGHAILNDVALMDETVYAVVGKYPGTGQNFEQRYDHLYALDVADGTERWRVEDLPGEGSTGWGVYAENGSVFVSWENGDLVRFDRSGRKRWRTSLDAGVDFGPVEDGRLYVGVESVWEDAYAIEVEDGTTAWRHAGDSDVAALVDGTVYCSGGSYDDGITYTAVDADDGETSWRNEVRSATFATGAAIGGGTVYAGLGFGQGADLYAFDAETGCLSGKLDLGASWLSTPVVVDDTVYVLSDVDGGTLTAITTS